MVSRNVLLAGPKCLSCLLVFSFWMVKIVCGFLLPWTPFCPHLAKLLSAQLKAQASDLYLLWRSPGFCDKCPWRDGPASVWDVSSVAVGKQHFISTWLAVLRTERSVWEISKCVILLKKAIKTVFDESWFRGWKKFNSLLWFGRQRNIFIFEFFLTQKLWVEFNFY